MQSSKGSMAHLKSTIKSLNLFHLEEEMMENPTDYTVLSNEQLIHNLNGANSSRFLEESV